MRTFLFCLFLLPTLCLAQDDLDPLAPPTTPEAGEIPLPVLSAEDSLAMVAAVERMSDSLRIGIRQLQLLWRDHQQMPTDSIKLTVQYGEGRHWQEYALNQAPRRGMTGQEWIRIGHLFGWLYRFDVQGSFQNQLNAYRWAAMDPVYEYDASKLLLNNYHEAGFAPGMLDACQRLMNLDRDRAIEDGVEKEIAIAYYIVGDRKAALKWIKAYRRRDLDREDKTEADSLYDRIRSLPKN